MSFSEKLKLMELELQYQDDNSSSSSSHSNPTSEEIDDLKLGAEANCFGAKTDKQDSNGMRRLVRKFLVLKKTKEQNCTISTISNISDLIEAREGELEDMLMGLGFIPAEDESRSSILSRFRPADKKSSESKNQQKTPEKEKR